jgi:thiosulfate/3-mercaptopyruvate sulfurtransferase
MGRRFFLRRLCSRLRAPLRCTLTKAVTSNPMKLSRLSPRYSLATIALVASLVTSFAAFGFHSDAAKDPWSTSQTVEPPALAAELSSTKGAKPTIVYVGFRPLYEGAHIPGASFHGATGKPEGLADLKAFAQPIPRDTNLVIYCGCCPLERCPNIRAACTALNDMGFTHLRVLLLPTDFNTDWITKGYPVEKGQ